MGCSDAFRPGAQTSVIVLVRREAGDDVVVALLGVGEAEEGVDSMTTFPAAERIEHWIENPALRPDQDSR